MSREQQNADRHTYSARMGNKGRMFQRRVLEYLGLLPVDEAKQMKAQREARHHRSGATSLKRPSPVTVTSRGAKNAKTAPATATTPPSE